jgi:hypothetical protein
VAAQVSGLQVRAHAPHAWILFGEGDALYLDVNCSLGPVGTSLLVELDADEARAFREQGIACVDRLAQRIADAGPASPYAARDRTRELGERATAAFLAWRDGPP